MNIARQRGFTLIEMVVAFTILAITLTAIFETMAAAMERSRHDAHLGIATLFGQSLLARAGSDWALEPGIRTGEWNGYDYQVVERLRKDPPSMRPRLLPTIEVSASVSWEERAARRSISISTLKFLPSRAP